MKRSSEFPFERARRISAGEVKSAHRAIERHTGRPRPARGRPPKPEGERHRLISIRLQPRVLAWARRVASRRGIGYQTVINEALLKSAR